MSQEIITIDSIADLDLHWDRIAKFEVLVSAPHFIQSEIARRMRTTLSNQYTNDPRGTHILTGIDEEGLKHHHVARIKATRKTKIILELNAKLKINIAKWQEANITILRNLVSLNLKDNGVQDKDK